MEVLIVDDDPVARMLMTRLLLKLGCKVSTAENGETALKMILGGANPTYTYSGGPASTVGGPWERSSLRDSRKYDIIFLDNHMPGISGRMTVAKLRELKRRDFVVGVTGERRSMNEQDMID
jgi:osomolarity two-component system, sensor histidine kinase SLN1